MYMGRSLPKFASRLHTKALLSHINISLFKVGTSLISIIRVLEPACYESTGKETGIHGDQGIVTPRLHTTRSRVREPTEYTCRYIPAILLLVFNLVWRCSGGGLVWEWTTKSVSHPDPPHALVTGHNST